MKELCYNHLPSSSGAPTPRSPLRFAKQCFAIHRNNSQKLYIAHTSDEISVTPGPVADSFGAPRPIQYSMCD